MNQDSLSTSAAVYRHISADGEVLYVGCAMNPMARFNLHRSQSPWARSVATIQIEWFDTLAAALAEEKRLIETIRPRCNRQISRAKPVRHAPAPLGACRPILSEILTFIAARGMARSQFGVEALGDPGFVAGLEKGREPRRATLARVKGYMLTAQAPARNERGAA